MHLAAYAAFWANRPLEPFLFSSLRRYNGHVILFNQ